MGKFIVLIILIIWLLSPYGVDKYLYFFPHNLQGFRLLLSNPQFSQTYEL